MTGTAKAMELDYWGTPPVKELVCISPSGLLELWALGVSRDWWYVERRVNAIDLYYKGDSTPESHGRTVLGDL